MGQQTGDQKDGLSTELRDVFLSHRSTDKPFVRELAEDLARELVDDRPLSAWVDEAEIRPGQSIPGLINQGLESSRFVALVMSPDYFNSPSGWTDAEWHAALHQDPDNRRGRIIPIIAEDCPYIPVLLRHLRALDFRSRNYSSAFDELVATLRGETISAPSSVRGRLISSSARIDRTTLVAERAPIDARPDTEAERLYSNLVPAETIPRRLYSAALRPELRVPGRNRKLRLPRKSELRDAIRAQQQELGLKPFTPAFRLREDRILTFHDLQHPDNPFAGLIAEDSVEVDSTHEALEDADSEKIVISLLNMAVSRHAYSLGLASDDTWQRFHFTPYRGGERIVTWRPKSAKAKRTVVKPCRVGDQVQFWRHLAAQLHVTRLANRLYLQVVPTWVITEDGDTVKTGPRVGRLVNRWTNPERNLHVLYHVRFWTMTLKDGRRGPIRIRAGDQSMELSTVPAHVELDFGIRSDQKDALGLLDQEAALLAAEEDKAIDESLASAVAEAALESLSVDADPTEHDDDWEAEHENDDSDTE